MVRAMATRARAQELTWYHTLELAPGHLTDGVFDLRQFVPRYGLPERLDGVRALDVGTFDGFWAFEMERRGAEVVALDVDHDEDLDRPPNHPLGTQGRAPRGEAFRVARKALGSRVERVALSVYEATPERLGTFDLVFCASVLIHLRDALLALEHVYSLCTHRFISAEAYERLLSLVPLPVARYRADRKDKAPVFWEPNVATWKRLLQTVGFDPVDEFARFKLCARGGWDVPHVVHHARVDRG